MENEILNNILKTVTKNSDLYHSLDKNLAKLSGHVKFQNGRVAKLEDKTSEMNKEVRKMHHTVAKYAGIITGGGVVLQFLIG